MLKRILVAALWLPLLALAQSYPSPTFQNLTVNGTFTATGKVGLASLAAQAANTVVGNATGSSASPTAITVTGCNGAAQALQWTNGSGFQCNSSIATSGANANITSLSGLTTPLSVPQGGIGAATLAQYNVLAGNGTSAISAIAPSTSGFVLTSNGASAFPTFQALPSGRLIGVQVFTSSGTYTPTTGTSSVIVEVQAPGGGGGAVSATGSGQVALAQPGSGGSYAKVRITSGFSGATVTIGSTGTGGAAGTNAGTTGGTTSFGTFVSCPGGNGGAGSAAVSPPAGQSPAAVPSACTVTSATTLVSTSGGQGTGAWAPSATTAFVGEGGASLMGLGSGTGSGSGGNSAAIAQSVSATAGSNASAAKIIVYEYN